MTGAILQGGRTASGMKKVNGRMGEGENGRRGDEEKHGARGQRQVLQVLQVVQVLQVTYNEDLTLKDTKRLTLSLLLLFTPFPSRPDSYRELSGSPKGEKLLQMEVTAQFVYQISRAALRVPFRYNNVITCFGPHIVSRTPFFQRTVYNQIANNLGTCIIPGGDPSPQYCCTTDCPL